MISRWRNTLWYTHFDTIFRVFAEIMVSIHPNCIFPVLHGVLYYLAWEIPKLKTLPPTLPIIVVNLPCTFHQFELFHISSWNGDSSFLLPWKYSDMAVNIGRMGPAISGSISMCGSSMVLCYLNSCTCVVSVVTELLAAIGASLTEGEAWQQPPFSWQLFLIKTSGCCNSRNPSHIPSNL